jgi:small-conductance mechanosensitive channel
LRSIRIWLALACLCLAFSGVVRAAEDTARETLDSVKATLAEIDDELKLENLSDGQLVQLRARSEPLVGQLQSVIVELTPRLEASRKRLAELKPKNADATTPQAETDPAADELKAEQAKFDKLDADLRSARAALLQTDDYIARISADRRDIFTQQTFARSASVLSPPLWLSVAREAPGDFTAFEQLLVDAGKRLAARATAFQLGGFLGVLALLLALTAPLRWVARRVIVPKGEGKPGRLRRAVAALWTLAVQAALPLVALGIVSYALDLFDISDPRLQGVVNALFDGLRMTALAYAFARALLAPRRAPWRLLRIGDEAAARLTRLVLSVAIVWSAAHLVEAIAETASSYNLLVLTRGVSSIAIAALAADAFRKLAHSPEAAAPARDVGRPVRTFAWIYLVAVIVCALAGYIALATYLIDHVLQFVGVVGALYLADALLQESCERLLHPESTFAQGLVGLLGLRRSGLEQIVVLVQGAARLTVVALAIVVAVGPFGMPSQDLVASLRSVYFGVSVGGVTLSLSTLVTALVAFFLILAATRGAQSWLGERYLPRTKLDAGVKNSIRTIFGYVGVVVALLAGGVRLGLDADRLAWIAGGLSVGIGFGLQSIANNFVSGLILLWEQGVRVGDWVVIGQDQGFVRRINARSTEIETFERATLIVPNLTLVTGSVKNWMHTDRVARLVVNVNAAFESDPEAVRKLLIDAAKAQDAVLSIPAPLALFSEIADWAMKFELICYVEEALMAERVRSELNFDIMARMRAQGLRIPYPFPVGSEDARGPNAARLT